MKPEDNFDKNSLIKGYKDIYNNGGFGYIKENELNILDIIEGCGTLLDIGCGNGFWSDILAQRFKVTGIDISPEGIFAAQNLRPDINFIEGDFLQHDFNDKFNVVFARSPSFLNVPTLSTEFYNGVLSCLKPCNHSLWYIKWSVPPYNRYLEGSYIHNPDSVLKVFKSISKDSKVIIKGNYFYANILV